MLRALSVARVQGTLTGPAVRCVVHQDCFYGLIKPLFQMYAASFATTLMPVLRKVGVIGPAKATAPNILQNQVSCCPLLPGIAKSPYSHAHK